MIVLKHSLFQHTTWMNEASHVLITLSTVVGRYIPPSNHTTDASSLALFVIL